MCEGLTPHDRQEMWLFYTFLRTMGDNPHRDPREVYAEVYSKRTPH